MAWLEFSHVHSYSSRGQGISVPVILSSGSDTANVLAFIDTGASNCLFERAVGEMLGLDIEAGDLRIFSAASGPVKAFRHMVSMNVLNLKVDSIVYFFADEISLGVCEEGPVGWTGFVSVWWTTTAKYIWRLTISIQALGISKPVKLPWRRS